MPVFMDDPSVLTKERLKSELLAHNVELPGGNPPRDVYVQLYVKTLSAQSHGTDATRDGFSSDEELPPPPVTRRSRSSGRKSEAARLDVTLLTDEALRDQLLVHGVHAGPIVASTRKLYEKKLQKLQDKGAVLSEPQKNHSSSQEAELYSDQEEEPTADTGPRPAPEPEPVPEQKDGVRSRRNNISQRLSSSQHSTVPEDLRPLSTEKEAEKTSYSPVRGPLPPSSRCAASPVASVLSSRPAPAHGHVDPGSGTRHGLAPSSVTIDSPSRPGHPPVGTLSSVRPTPALDPVVPVSSSRSAQLALAPGSCSGPAPARGLVARGSSTRPPKAVAPGSPWPFSPQVPLDPLTSIFRCNISPILKPSQTKPDHVLSAATEKVQKVEQVEKIQTDPPPEEDPAVPELSFTGLTASCRRPIKGAAGRPVILSNRSQSAHTEIKVSNSTSSITNTANPALSSAHSAPSYTSPASSRATPTLPDASAPSARQAKAQGGISWWKKLLLWAVLAGFLFLVYQAMETNSAAPFEEAKEM
ncbi:lamina-associated polypeptide 2-like isoform X2 [Boleophthalmus pectinirostris]|uniref:lamina-associated polypeptide 2-like isoform X2 n=1 Tax=Boleophthalmus pectinirostris TaxID=150288 RepID=UPI00242D0EFF|nr:lamina-associated polypeptide 2-like isoform X2 [Boleophthalmus pectinirostris]